MDTTTFQLCLAEITADIPVYVYLSSPNYDEDDPSTTQKIKHLLKLLRKMKNRSRNDLFLYYLYLIGQLIEEEDDLRELSKVKRQVSAHYQKLAKRVCSLFDQDRLPLILGCKGFTPTSLKSMSRQNYLDLLAAGEEATANRDFLNAALDGTQALEGENL